MSKMYQVLSIQHQQHYNMQLSLILGNSPTKKNIDVWKDRVWINTANGGLYHDSNRVFPNYDNVDSPATLGDLDRELKKRNYLSLEPKFINSNGDLVLNLNKNNITYNKVTRKNTYFLSEEKGKSVGSSEEVIIGTTLRTYRKMETDYLNCDTSLKIIDFLNTNVECQIVFPEDKTTFVNLTEVSKKFIIPGVSCELKRLVITCYDSEKETEKVLVENGNDLLFKYEHYENNECRKEYNTGQRSFCSESEVDFILDLTENGMLSLYYTGDKYTDFFIKSCSVIFKL